MSSPEAIAAYRLRVSSMASSSDSVPRNPSIRASEPERTAEIVQRRLTRLPGVALRHHHADPLAVLEPAHCLRPVVVVADAPLGLFGHLDLGDQRADGRIPAAEFDPGELADHTAAAVA